MNRNILWRIGLGILGPALVVILWWRISRLYTPDQLERALHELTPKPPEVLKAVVKNY